MLSIFLKHRCHGFLPTNARDCGVYPYVFSLKLYRKNAVVDNRICDTPLGKLIGLGLYANAVCSLFMHVSAALIK
jgi:hypothetical protein